MMSMILVKGVKKVKQTMRTDLFFKEKKFLFFLFCVKMQENFFIVKPFFLKKKDNSFLFCVRMQKKKILYF